MSAWPDCATKARIMLSHLGNLRVVTCPRRATACTRSDEEPQFHAFGTLGLPCRPQPAAALPGGAFPCKNGTICVRQAS